jgi:hypothetical protein
MRLPETLASVSALTFTDYEIIVVSNGEPPRGVSSRRREYVNGVAIGRRQRKISPLFTGPATFRPGAPRDATICAEITSDDFAFAAGHLRIVVSLLFGP